jgi:hypothetical protein
MAQTDKNIVITPNIGQTADPKVVYSGANATVGAQTVTLNVYPASSGTLSWEGSAGQLLSVTNTLTGTIFAVNDVSGIPSITVQDTGQVTLAPYTGNLVIGNLIDAGTAKVQITGAVSATGNITSSGNVQGGNLRTAGLISATGAITGAALTGTSLTVSTGNAVISAGNVGIGTTSPAAKLAVVGTGYSPTITLTDGATLNWDTSLGQVAQVTLGGNRTFAAPTNLVNGGFYSLLIIQDGTGSRTISWNAVFDFAGGTAPTLSTAAGAKDLITWRSDGTNMLEVGRSLGVA